MPPTVYNPHIPPSGPETTHKPNISVKGSTHTHASCALDLEVKTILTLHGSPVREPNKNHKRPLVALSESLLSVGFTESEQAVLEKTTTQGQPINRLPAASAN